MLLVILLCLIADNFTLTFLGKLLEIPSLDEVDINENKYVKNICNGNGTKPGLI